ncbi:hypothetical protein BJ170DRAFT_436334 [Xylariales sp. AK1849]|nr:hypothetical protein BJ170DRAFT_436334 [Xylariales sp. AK1849]
MRLDASTIWLAASCLLSVRLAGADSSSGINTSGTGGTTSPNTVILFEAWSLPGLFMEAKGDQRISWTTTSSAIVSQAFLRRQLDNVAVGYGSRDGYPASTGASDERRSGGTGFSVVGKQVVGLAARQGLATPTIHLPFDSETSGGSVTLEIGTSPSDYVNTGSFNQMLYLELDWENSTTVGKSYSAPFAVTNLTDTDQAAYKTLSTTVSNSETEDLRPYKPESSESIGDQATPSETAASSTAAATGTATSTPSATSGVTVGTSGSSSAAGLSTGAIAGIAVACGVVGLAIIGALTWFLCLRRRRNDHSALQQHNGSYASGGAVAPMMGDKEHPRVTDSPHSAYAADRGALHDPNLHDQRSSMVVGSVQGHEDERSSYAPYSDRAPTPGTGTGPMTSQTSLPGGGTRSPTPPLATRYTHLIEEGMTENEIRRLEEEERHLDAAIEDAGRTSRATGTSSRAQ